MFINIDRDRSDNFVILSNLNLTELPPNLHNTTTMLNCSHNRIASLGDLPPNLKLSVAARRLPRLLRKQLDCSNNQLTSLGNLPNTLTHIWCYKNQITHFENLPPNLIMLNCEDNQLQTLDYLPNSLRELWCAGNPLVYEFEWTLENIKSSNSFVLK
jgi:hypothetical protein